MATELYQRLIDKYEPLTEAAFLTLVSVCEPISSAEIPAKIASLTNGQLQLGLGTLYTNLHMMTRDYLITERVDADETHTYEITGSGTAVLAAERDRLALLNQIMKNVRL
ncbi:PadR family transcriptional regulator [Lactiplantibacillus daowaiensis]|uniref:PadR family transcriptional regulator n=1 Tax=Lactiplantibacillus daowaiensis TaxID=2559918 RepID=A0ABW1S3F6_9LACO|nr:helix-turn-helix transcriptional regulator [Lactiplantibacillus daowaiensis]